MFKRIAISRCYLLELLVFICKYFLYRVLCGFGGDEGRRLCKCGVDSKMTGELLSGKARPWHDLDILPKFSRTY